MWLVSCSNYHVLTSNPNYCYLWSGLDKLQAVPLICMASTIQPILTACFVIVPLFPDEDTQIGVKTLELKLIKSRLEESEMLIAS